MRKRACSLYLLLVALMMAGYGLFVCEQSIAHELPSNIIVNTQCKDKKLGTILERIIGQNGYRVQVDDDLSDILVTGVFTSVSLDNFLRRALKKENYSLIIDQQNKEVRVYSLGKNKKGINKLPDAVNSLDPTGRSSQAVQIREKQDNYLKIVDNDPDYREPVSGKTLPEIKEIHSKQLAEGYLGDPNAVEPVSGISVAVIENIHNKQEATLQEIRSDPEAIIPGIGLSESALETIHRKQKATLKNTNKYIKTGSKRVLGRGK